MVEMLLNKACTPDGRLLITSSLSTITHAAATDLAPLLLAPRPPTSGGLAKPDALETVLLWATDEESGPRAVQLLCAVSEHAVSAPPPPPPRESTAAKRLGG
ncbi:hypothetical protein T484DRAFT_1884616, partial [Baffinella frigidus]